MRYPITNDVWQKLVNYYLDALKNERDKSVQFPVNLENSDNLFIQTDSHLLSVSTVKKPEVLDLIKNRPTYLNANLYLGYPTFIAVDTELLLQSKCRFLVSDVFSGYNKSVNDINKIRAKKLEILVEHAYCNAHARRKFKEAGLRARNWSVTA